MQRKRRTKNKQLAARYEDLEQRLVMSANSLAMVADFQLPSLEDQTQQQDDDLSMQLADAHVLSGLAAANAEYGFTGAGQTVAVIDSGIAYDHAALGGGFGEDFRVVGGWDFTEENDADPYDDGYAGSHGTHVAGIIGSDDATHTGVAPGVDLVSLRVFNDAGEGYFSWVEDALQWVHTNRNAFANPITAVNISLGVASWNADSIPNWANLEDEFAQLEADGIFIAVAAGNHFDDYNATGLSYPAASSYVVPVASVNGSGDMSYFSQRNDRVIAAPGQGIISTAPDYVGNFNGQTDDFANFSGTSMASPYVAGASTLLREAYSFMGTDSVTQDDLYDLMTDTADSIWDSETNQYYNRLNLDAALDAIMGPDDFGSNVAGAYSLGSLADNQSVDGIIGSLNDADYFTFTAAATGTASFSLDCDDAEPNWMLVGGGETLDGHTMSFDVVGGQSYSVALLADAGLAHYSFNAEIAETVLDLGSVDYLHLVDTAAQSDGTWYQLNASQTGTLTIEALFEHAAGDVQLEVYDSSGQTLLASSDTTSDNERVDFEVSAGDQLLIKVTGTNADVDLRITNLVAVSGDSVQISGTSGDDSFVYQASRNHRFSINGTLYKFDGLNTISFDGGAGIDTASLTGSKADDTAIFRPGELDLTSAHYSVHVTDSETIRVYGGGGWDYGVFNDSAGDDKFYGNPGYSLMKGDGFMNFATNFDRIDAVSNAGGFDRGFMYDSAGNDKFYGKTDYSVMICSGYINFVRNFDQVNASATTGTDLAFFYDSAGDDVLKAKSTFTSLKGDGFYNRATGFDRTYASATGGYDQAFFFDSSGDDRLKSTAAFTFLKGDGFNNRATGFDYVRATATGGNDRATFIDSAGDESVFAGGNQFEIDGDDFFNTAEGFDWVNWLAAGGDDHQEINTVDYVFAKLQ